MKRTDGRKRIIAPPLANGDSRVKDYGRLPEAIKEGLRDIARMEGKSMSWVKEEVIIQFFGLRRPKYKLTGRHVAKSSNVVSIKRRA